MKCIIHFLTRCREPNKSLLREMNSYLLERHESKSKLINEIFSDNYNTAKLIRLYCLPFLKKKECHRHRIEKISRGLCYKLTQLRTKIFYQI